MTSNFLGVIGFYSFLSLRGVLRFILIKSFLVALLLFVSFLGVAYPVLAVLLPVVGALGLLAFSRYISRFASIFFLLFVSCSSFLGILGFFLFDCQVCGLGESLNFLFVQKFLRWNTWVGVYHFDSYLGWMFDSLSVHMLVLVGSASFLIHVYSVSYMWTDPSLIRFLCYLSLFTFFMYVLVTSPNFFQLFFGWEGVGLMSYLLVGFWYDRQQASKAAWKAVFVNRIGDFALFLCICISFSLFQTFDFFDIFSQICVSTYTNLQVCGRIIPGNFYDLFSGLVSSHLYVEVLVFLLFFGAVAKSAQFGLHSWLPDAMEGPTPVSALIHAATMVTAGVFVLIRLSPLLNLSVFAPYYMALVGSLTCVYAGLLAAVQVDAKKLVAYSTMSQLGYMILGCSAGDYGHSFFHLWIHGYVKALLFLSVGVVIHFLTDEQSMGRMAALRVLMPFSFLLLLSGSFSLMAVPIFSGYFSKEGIIDLIPFALEFGVGEFAYVSSLLGTLFTGFYSIKLVIFLFNGVPNYSLSQLRVIFASHLKPRSGVWIYLPLLVLAVLSVLVGRFVFSLFLYNNGGYTVESSSLTSFWLYGVSLVVSRWEALGFNEFYSVDQYLFMFLIMSVLYKFPVADFYVLLSDFDYCSIPFPVIFTVVGGFLSAVLYTVGYSVLRSCYLFKIVARKLFFDKVINIFLCRRGLLTFYKTLFLSLDRGVLELFGPSGLTTLFLYVGRVLSGLQTGSVIFYIGVIVWSTAILFFFFTVC